MKMNPIESSAIAEHGYDPDTRTMRVKLKSGKTYDHQDVPLEKYAAFTGAASAGRFYNKEIKRHPAKKVK